MSAETDVYSALSGYAGLTVIVSTRIYPDVLPDTTAYPAVVFARENTVPLVAISNHYYGALVDLKVACWSDTRTQAESVATQAQAALLAAGIQPTGKNTGYDPDTDLFASIIDINILEQP